VNIIIIYNIKNVKRIFFGKEFKIHPVRPIRILLFKLLLLFTCAAYLLQCTPLPFMMFDRPEVILIFSIAQECLCTERNYTRFGSLFVKLYHNRCSSTAYCYVLLLLLLLLLYCCNNNIIIISPSLKANRKFMHTIAVDRRRSRHWSSATDGQRLYNNNITWYTLDCTFDHICEVNFDRTKRHRLILTTDIIQQNEGYRHLLTMDDNAPRRKTRVFSIHEHQQFTTENQEIILLQKYTTEENNS